MPDVIAGEWLPDRTELSAPAVRTVRNLLRVADGYRTLPDTIATTLGALNSACRGAAWGRLQTEGDYIAAGTADSLYLATSGSFVDETPVSPYSLGGADRWEFEQYGDRLFAVANGIPQTFLVGTSTEFADLSADASQAKLMMVFKDALVLGNIVGRGVNASAIGTQESGIHWSENQDPTSWPAVGTQDAANKLSDFQALEGDGGPVTEMVASTEYAVIFRERQMWRMDFVGPPEVFQLRKISGELGCTIQGSAISVKGLVFFISEEGFMVFDGSRVLQIGHEKVDRYWAGLQNFANTALARVSVIHDFGARSICWGLPTSADNPNLILGYQYELGQWWSIEKEMEWLLSARYLTGSMDAAPLATLDMDAAGVPPVALGDQDMDALGGGELEKPFAFLSDHQLYAFDSPRHLNGYLEWADLDAEQRAMLRFVRPVYRGTGSISVQVASRLTPNGAITYGPSKDINAIGVVPYRSAGRYHRLAMTTQDIHDLVHGFDFTAGSLGTK